MLAAEDALHSEFDAYEDCFDGEAALVPLDLLDVKDRLAAWAHMQPPNVMAKTAPNSTFPMRDPGF